MLPPTASNTLDDVSYTVNEVKQLIDKLKVSKSPGMDMFYPRVLKKVKDGVYYHLTKNFNESIEDGIATKDWKYATLLQSSKEEVRTS